MSKEIVKIPLKGFTKFIREPNENWSWISEESIDTDLEKALEDFEVILQRKSDKKYFKFQFSESAYNGIERDNVGNDDPMVGVEVFPKEKKIIVYE